MHNVRFSHIHSRKNKNIFYVFCLSRQSHSSIQKGTAHKSFFLSCAPFLPSCLSTPLCCMEKSLSCWPKLLTCCSFLQTSKSLFLTGIFPLIFSRKRALESAESPYFSMVLWSLDIVEVIGSSPTNPTTQNRLSRKGLSGFCLCEKATSFPIWGQSAGKECLGPYFCAAKALCLNPLRQQRRCSKSAFSGLFFYRKAFSDSTSCRCFKIPSCRLRA